MRFRRFVMTVTLVALGPRTASVSAAAKQATEGSACSKGAFGAWADAPRGSGLLLCVRVSATKYVWALVPTFVSDRFFPTSGARDSAVPASPTTTHVPVPVAGASFATRVPLGTSLVNGLGEVAVLDVDLPATSTDGRPPALGNKWVAIRARGCAVGTTFYFSGGPVQRGRRGRIQAEPFDHGVYAQPRRSEHDGWRVCHGAGWG